MASSAAGVALVSGGRQATGKAVATKERRPAESKAALLLLAPLLLLALAAAPAAAQYPPTCPSSSDVTSHKTSSETASLYTSAPYGTCGNCYVSMYASDGITKDQPGKPTKTSDVELYLSCYDSCASGGYSGYYAGYSSSDPTGVNVSKNLKSASVTSSLNLDYSYGYGGSTDVPPSTASVSVSGNANGQSSSNTKCSYTYSYATPCGTVVSSHTNNNNGYQSASFTGSITLGGTTYAVADPSGTGNGAISKYDNIQKTMVKNH
jgi:hypothetical protein